MHPPFIIPLFPIHTYTSSIACQLAKVNAENKDYVTGEPALIHTTIQYNMYVLGLQYYREALLHYDTDCTARLALAELLLLSGNLEQCEEECMTVLKIQPTHTEAAMVCMYMY